MEQTARAGLSLRLRPATALVIAAGIVLALVAGYAVAGFAVAQARIASADSALSTVISHQNQLNTSFNEINSQFTPLAGGAFNPTQAADVTTRLIAHSRTAGETADRDDAMLVRAAQPLSDQAWLTILERGRLDHEAARINHARKALSYARTLAADLTQYGHFWQALFVVLADLDTANTQTSAGDFTGAKATLGTMKGHLDDATRLSTAPGLPHELQSLMADFQSLSADFGKLLDAAQANDAASLGTYEQSVQNDSNRISAYNFDQMSSEIDAFYKPLVDGFNSEMAAAAA